MKETIESIAEVVVNNADKEEIVFTRKSVVDNMLQLIFEQRVNIEGLDTAVTTKAKPEEHKKIYNYFASELIKYLSAKLVKSRLSSFRSAAKKPEEQQKKLSRSEQFLERKRKEALEKASKEDEDKAGKAERIGLKDIGKDIEEREETMKELEKKREDQQRSTEEEYNKHTFAYQVAFELFAHAVKVSAGKDNNVDELCTIIKQIGDSDMTKRQATLGKLAGHPNCSLALEALVAAMRDKNIILQVVNVLNKMGERRCIMPLINLIKEYPTPSDSLFRGPAEQTIGETVRSMNEKEKNSGTKYIYQLCNNPKFEPMLRVLARIVSRDINDSKIRNEYFTPQCLKWISLVAEKLAEQKKKTVKVAFVNVTRPTDMSKLLTELVGAARQHTS